MCESMRLYRERVFAEGKDAGKVEGCDEGINIGIPKGERIGIIDLLNYKFGKLSPETVEQIKASSTEQLNQLKMKMSNI